MTTILRLLPLLLVLTACDDSPGGQVGDSCTKPGNVCSTPACSQFPTQGGCSSVKPSGSYCPVDRYRCWDPSTAAGYCDPMVARCGKAKTPPGMCKPPLCTLAALTACYDTNDDIFCSNGFACQRFSCTSDGGTDGGASDAGGDGAQPDDASTPPDQTAPTG